MADANNQSVSQQASVAPELATMKRSVSMAWFVPDQETRDRVAYTKVAETLGQMIGRIVSVTEREGKLRDGTIKMSLVATGSFECARYSDNEVRTSTTAYLPAFFLEAARDILARDPGSPGIDFAIEIVMEPTGKAIPVAYTVRDLYKAKIDDPLQVIKRELQQAGQLRLSPPRSPVGPERTLIDGTTGEIIEAPAGTVEPQGAPRKPKGVSASKDSGEGAQAA